MRAAAILLLAASPAFAQAPKNPEGWAQQPPVPWVPDGAPRHTSKALKLTPRGVMHPSV